jgi:PAS domain S-box-containing protein
MVENARTAESADKSSTRPDTDRFELLLNSVDDYAIYMLDANGFVTSWNAGAEKIKGYTSNEILGRHFSLFFTPEDRRAGSPERILEVARSLGRHEAEGWRVRKGGGRFWCNAVLHRIRDDAGKLIGFAKVTRDITERKSAQEALASSERALRMLVKGVVDYAIYMLDPSGVVVSWNAGAERLKGYTSEEIIGQHFSRFYTREDRADGLPARVLHLAAREGRYEAEAWRVRKDGSRFLASVVVDAIYDEAGSVGGFAKVTRDVTERRAAQEALRESERQFRLLVAGVTDYALYMLDPNGVVTSWNAGAKRIKGYEGEEIIGHHFSRFYTDGDRAAGLPARALNTALQDGRFEAEGWRVRKSGTLFWANVVIDPIRDEAGTLIGFAKITRDITERREAQKALEASQAQRAHAQKMDALGQLTGGVAHDFNNLLMVVSGQVRTLRKRLSEDVQAEPKIARALDAIEIAARNGAGLTRQLLSFSHRQPSNPTVIALSEHVDGVRVLLRSSLGPGMTLTTAIERLTWPVKVDANELELSLVNLVLNARDAMSDGGVVSITTENVTLSALDTKAGITGEFVALSVADTGHGIAPDVIEKVFDPFFTTKRTSNGTGLGLSQVYGFAQQSGGTVSIQSALNKGTTVTLYLPRVDEEVVASSFEPEAVSVGGGVVLVVEDNPEVAQVSVGMLEQLGYQVHLARDARAALEVIDRVDFDLVVSDIVMPGELDGVALAHAICKHKPELPVLLVTGYSRGPTEGFTVLRKPLDPDQLGAAAARLIRIAKSSSATNVVPLRPTDKGR